MHHQKRIEKIRAHLARDSLNAILIINRENGRYLSGFTGSDGKLLITSKKVFLFIDSRYYLQAEKEAAGLAVLCLTSDFISALTKVSKEEAIKNLGFESNEVTIQGYQKLEQNLTGITLIPTTDLTESLRSIKDIEEIELIKQAQNITDRAFSHIVGYIKESHSEKEIAWELESWMRLNGAESVSFMPIVASGMNAAEPHHRSSDKRIKKGEMIILDFGAVVAGYSSDMTRTVFLGKPTARQKKIYEIVLSSQNKVLKKLKAGITTRKIDGIARAAVESESFGKFFQHNLGHGVGLTVHEEPTLGPLSDGFLVKDMICTIEPGIYLPGWGGVRIENLLLIKKDGAELLTRSPQEIEEMVI
ncbi:aminopeptidase P family protein [candidate division NPL-UPA2 bacterium Unc8]|uniref:Aminopeptidase P family protein n=1 Tax=candidate division NPL-UPA2 bacterium Unc8 TaxID=1980939 RepID=A0A399FZS1_UNCN2|nr:Aminopeptidase YpdF [Bacillota bacterium]MBT9147576.1 Aminopeptidase YpdF [Bacillota bacterium]RII00762.1 MAG: aminopeptidase P family protein [candidate division NPL-UPA2 bacterium Unc8]